MSQRIKDALTGNAFACQPGGSLVVDLNAALDAIDEESYKNGPELFAQLEVYLQNRLNLPGRRDALLLLGVAPSEIMLMWERDFWREKVLGEL